MSLADLRGVFAALAERHRLPGAQLAVRHGGRTDAYEYGTESAGSGRVVTRDSAFPVGSLTKPFTAALTLTLVADGDLELDTPVGTELPAGRYTLRQLLSHTAGLPSEAAGADGHRGGRRSWVERHARDADLVHEPGTVFSYSNVGYLVAGHLVESVTGLDWSEAVTDILLAPLGIRPGFVVGPRTEVRTTVTGHGSGGQVLARQLLPPVEEPNGGLALSAADLLAFAAAFGPDGPAPLDPAVAGPMCTEQLGDAAIGPYGMADGWCLGWASYRSGAGRLLGHDGTGDGTSCHLRFDPRTGTGIALTTNACAGQDLWRDLGAHLRDAGLTTAGPDEAPTGVGAPAPPECAGRYVNGETELEVTVVDGVARLAIGGRPYAVLACAPNLVFRLRDTAGGPVPYAGRFVRTAASGRIDHLQLSGRSARRDERSRAW